MVKNQRIVASAVAATMLLGLSIFIFLDVSEGEVNRAECPVTLPSEPMFVPPEGYAATAPFEDMYWYGTRDLWTILPKNGVWEGLAYDENTGHYFNKSLWWYEGYDWETEQKPPLVVEGEKFGEPMTTFRMKDATNAYNTDIGSTMLTGIEFPSLGCWKVTGIYKLQELSFIIWVAP